VVQGIENNIDILRYKLRAHHTLEYVQLLRNRMPSENESTKKHYDNWIDEIKKWCKEGNEKHFVKEATKT
jgi:hypothetical protein